MRKTALKNSAIFLILVLSHSLTSWAQSPLEKDTDSGAAMLVLDASGSMWGLIDNEGVAQTKIEIARDVIDEMLGTWDADTPLGLLAYGHRKKADCSDIEVLTPPAKLDVKAFSKQVRALSPTGKTPMVQSVIDAAEALSFESRKSTVILVSDGEETCGMDACAMGAALEAKGIDFTAHVIGFDVTLDQSAGMRCLADNTGGLYLDAENAEELSEAIIVVAEDTTSAPKEDVIGPATVDVVKDRVMGGTRFEVKWTGPENQRDYLMIKSPNGEQSYHRISIQYLKEKSHPILRAPETPGVYHVHYVDRRGASLAYDAFTVTHAKAFIKAPDAPVTGGTEFSIEITEPNARQDRVKIFNVEGKEVHSRTITLIRKKDGTATLQAPEDAGEYILKYVTPGGSVLAEAALTVSAAGASVETPKEPIIGGAKFSVAISEPNFRQDRVNIYDAAGEKVSSRTITLVRKEGGFASLIAPEEAGDYTVKYVTQDKNFLASDSITVIAATAEIDAPDAPISSGTKFKVKVSKPISNQDRLNIYDMAGKRVFGRSINLTIKNGEVTLNAPEEPGRYVVKYVTPKKNVLAEDMITVVAGK